MPFAQPLVGTGTLDSYAPLVWAVVLAYIIAAVFVAGHALGRKGAR